MLAVTIDDDWAGPNPAAPRKTAAKGEGEPENVISPEKCWMTSRWLAGTTGKNVIHAFASHVPNTSDWYGILPGSFTLRNNTGAVAGFVTRTLAVPVIPSEPVTGSGMGDSMVTFG